MRAAQGSVRSGKDTAVFRSGESKGVSEKGVRPVRLGSRWVGPGCPAMVIAEAGVNHNGDPAMARRLIDVAVDAGADAVKFQSYRTEKLVLPNAPKLGYQRKNTGSGTQWAMLKKLELTESAQRWLSAYCRRKGILFLSSPFEEESASFLMKLGVSAIKVPSGELTNHPFLETLAAGGVPLILSTGMATLREVASALRVVRDAGDPPVVLFHCVSAYPSLPEESNLKAMATLAEAFRVPVGFSDHSEGATVALAAVALGACAIEKHFTLNRSLAGPDHRASLNPAELKDLVRAVRHVSSALGDGIKRPVTREKETARAVRKSLVALTDIPKGEILRPAMVGALRPGLGLGPEWLERLLGRRARRRISAFTRLSLGMVQ